MKALTIWQPWASLIIAGAKPVEWRAWACPRWIVGPRIAIHAAMRPVKPGDLVEILQRIAEGESALVADIAKPLLLDVPIRLWPLSSVLGTAIIGMPLPALEWARQNLEPGYDRSRIDPAKFAWPLTDIERFEPPLPARGLQGFWNWHGGDG